MIGVCDLNNLIRCTDEIDRGISSQTVHERSDFERWTFLIEKSEPIAVNHVLDPIRLQAAEPTARRTSVQLRHLPSLSGAPLLVELQSTCQHATRTVVLESKNGSGTGTRTLNLAVNRSAPPVQKWRSQFAACRDVPHNAAARHCRCCTTSLSLTCP